MDIINLPRLRMCQLQSLGERSLKICRSIAEIKPSVEIVGITLNDFIESIQHEKATDSDKKNLDLLRNRLVTGFIRQISLEQIFPHEDQLVINTLQLLMLIVNKYGMKISRLPYDKESAAIDNMLDEVKGLDLDFLDQSSIARWIAPLEKANEEFKVASYKYNSESAEASSIKPASILAPQLIDALEGMYTMLYASIKINPTDDQKNAYAKLLELVDSYN